MRLHFWTRDLRRDYPQIGWLPPLPDGADQLWKQFRELHAGEYPEILLSRRNGQWRLYLSAIDSGRTDSVDGHGRRIRVSLYLSGCAGESAGVAGLIAQYLSETQEKVNAPRLLQDIFQAKIQPGDPEKWTVASASEQERIASELLTELAKFPVPPKDEGDIPPRWTGGCSSENRTRFTAFCEQLLSGRAEGMAVSLANLSSSDANQVLSVLRPDEHVAILLTTPEERNIPIRVIAERPHRSNPSFPAAPKTGKPHSKNDVPGKKIIFFPGLAVSCVLFWWLGGLLLLGAVVLLTGGILFWKHKSGRQN